MAWDFLLGRKIPFKLYSYWIQWLHKRICNKKHQHTGIRGSQSPLAVYSRSIVI
jgi:hypothetical protein